MRRNGMPGGLARRGWLRVGAAFVLMSLPAMAGDRAEIALLGYSPEHAFFAFEEFGIGDGSGFAYSTIYLADLVKDTWVAGTPFRAQAESETETLGAIREEAAKKAGPVLAQYEIGEPATIAALIGDGVSDETGKELRFGVPGYAAGKVLEELRLELTQFEAEATTPCAEYFGSTPLGFALTLSGGGETRQLHVDESLPASRGCAQDYRIYGVVLPFEAQTAEDGVAIISVYAGGFEGPDRRFLAVPLGE